MQDCLDRMLILKSQLESSIQNTREFIHMHGDTNDGYFTAIGDEIIVYIVSLLPLRSCIGFFQAWSRGRNVSSTVYSDYLRKHYLDKSLMMNVKAITEYVVSIREFLMAQLFNSTYALNMIIALIGTKGKIIISNFALDTSKIIIRIGPIDGARQSDFVPYYLITSAKYILYRTQSRAYFIDRLYINKILPLIGVKKVDTNIVTVPVCNYEFYLSSNQCYTSLINSIDYLYPMTSSPLKDKFMRLLREGKLPY